MKKVLIITYYWPPSGGAGVQRWVKFAKYLNRLGLKPFVLTVDPTYATYPQIDESLIKDVPNSVEVYYSKSFELYSFYKKISSNKEVPYGGFANTKTLDFKEKVLRFIRGNFFIPDPRKGWNKFALKKAKEIITEHKINTIITTSPPHSTHLIGQKLKQELNLQWIADFRDPWTEIYYFNQLYPTPIVKQIHLKMEKKILNQADKIITVSDDLKKILSSKIINKKDKIYVIQNGYDHDDFADKKLQNTPSQDNFYISYIGTISKDYNISGFIEAIKILSQEIKSKIKIRFVGKISEQIIQEFSENGLHNLIEIVGYVNHSDAIEYMLNSDMLLLIIPEIKNNKGILTGKLFEYLASQKPILCLGPADGDAAQIIAKTQSGQTFEYKDFYKMKSYLTQLLDSQKQNTSKQKEIFMYSRENLTKKLINLLEN